MKNRLVVLSVMFLIGSSALAAVRATTLCPRPSGIAGATGACFTGSRCVIGVRGDWLDLTDRASRVIAFLPPGQPIPRFDIEVKGVDDSGGPCVPATNRDREGFVRFSVTNVTTPGVMRIRLSRWNGFDTIDVPFRDGTFLSPNLRADSTTARVNEAKTFNLRGFNLNQLQTLDPDDTILEQNVTSARVRMTFDQIGEASLETKLAFAGGEPELNRNFGWPVVDVRAARPPQDANAADFPITITIAGDGSGTVTSNPAGINCPGTCSARFARFTNVGLTATAAGDSQFLAWRGDCASAGASETCGINNAEDADGRATAEFVRATTLTVEVTGTGTVSGSGVECGTGTNGICTVRFTQTDDQVSLDFAMPLGSRFVGWGGACPDPTARRCTFEMNGANRRVTAEFNP